MDELLREVQAEKEYILGTFRALNEALERKEKTSVELAAISTFLQNTYNRIENILKKVLKFKGISISVSESWHKDLLDLSVNNQIISLELSKRLDEYRAFRHFFIHGYGIMLDKEKLMPLAENLPDLWSDFESEVDTFIKSSRNKFNNMQCRTSDNRAYLATVLRTYAQIQPDGGTSDTLVTLGDIFRS